MSDKEVFFYQYCYNCKHYLTSDSEDPCDACLNEPCNEDSHKPVNFEEAK